MFLRILLLLLLFSEVAPLTAQQHFIYIQSADGKPFYIKTNNKTYNSSGSGYVVIPKLISGRFLIDVGWVDPDIPEQRFYVSVTDLDLGLRLRSVNGSWELADFHSDMKYAAEPGQVKVPGQDIQSTDPFTKMLSQVVSDPELLKKEKDVPAAVITNQPEMLPEDNKSLTPVSDSPKVVLKQAEIILPADSLKTVRKISGSMAGGRLESVYVVEDGKVSDTVSVLIENADDLKIAEVREKSNDLIIAEEGKKERSDNRGKKTDDEKNLRNADKEESKLQPDAQPMQGLENVNTAASAEEEKEKSKDAASVRSVYSFCMDSASTGEFLKLRKKMVAQPDEDQMVFAAKKYFRTGCFTTQQIRNLAVLFLQERTRFRFLEAASGAVYDKSNFGTLESLLTERDYISAFRNLTKTN